MVTARRLGSWALVRHNSQNLSDFDVWVDVLVVTAYLYDLDLCCAWEGGDDSPLANVNGAQIRPRIRARECVPSSSTTFFEQPFNGFGDSPPHDRRHRRCIVSRRGRVRDLEVWGHRSAEEFFFDVTRVKLGALVHLEDPSPKVGKLGLLGKVLQ